MTVRPIVFAAIAALLVSGCASVPRTSGPAYADLPAPEIPARLTAGADVREIHAQGWQRLQAGDLRGASAAYADALKRQPSFYPAETGLGLVALANRQFKPAVSRFTAALGQDAKYLPALRGLVAAEIGLEDFDAAATALERVIAQDPGHEADKNRLDLLRVRQVQQLMESGRRARSGGRHVEAADAFRRALAISPSSTTLMRELALEELASGQIAEAEGSIRKALQLDATDAETHAALGAVLEARGHLVEAAAAYAQAASIDSKWRAKAEAARAAAVKSGLPDELRDMATATTVTRGHLAALIGIRMAALLDRAPKRPPVVATDIRTHWAASWIVPVTQAGVMDVFANHTFQPTAIVQRGDLARVSARLISLALADQPAELTRLQAVHPPLVDVANTNVVYRSAALAVAAGVMKADEGGRFQPTQPVSGADVLAAIARLEQLGAR